MNLLLDVLTTAAILYIVSAGLLLIFGVMKIVNFAHGAFLTVGAYASLVSARLGLPPAAGFLAALLVGGLIGMVIERLVVRPLYARPLVNRNPAQTNRDYRPSLDAAPWGMGPEA